jgi:hypothetical protein
MSWKRYLGLSPEEETALPWSSDYSSWAGRQVSHCRRNPKRGREIDPIRTVRGMGYSFDERFGRS